MEFEVLVQNYFYRLKSKIYTSGYLGQQPVYKTMTEIQPINNAPKVSKFSICYHTEQYPSYQL